MSSDGTSTTTLSLARYRVTFEALEPLALPEYLWLDAPRRVRPRLSEALLSGTA
ncbi:MAG TPA: hypothetical protein VGQ77_13835 [Methylomirabilota bacterium]|jgi:hypothetical protein|nr:hypothetical protein [Methylomirabilota bacterium]